MNISNTGLNLIKSFEGCHLTAYRCPAGIWTIGWGHTGNDVYEGLSISQGKADELLYNDVQKFVNAVNQYQDRFNFNQNQFNALVSFSYNCGIGSLNTVMSVCNTKEEIAEEFKLYNKGAGVVLPGLVRRREAEYRLYNKQDNSETIKLVEYEAHVQDIGWQDKKSDGQVSGTVGESKRLEALNVVYNGDGYLEMMAHIQDIGWTSPVKSGQILGTMNVGKRLEAICLCLKDTDKEIHYRVHVSGQGWQEWKSQGDIAGTTGESRTIEAIEIYIKK